MSQETEWFQGFSLFHKDPVTVTPSWLLILAGCLLAAWAWYANAEPLYRAQGNGLTVTLTDEPCALEAVSNLPKRAVWIEAGVTYEGCWGYRSDLEMIIGYFSDKTVALMPAQAFTKVSGV